GERARSLFRANDVEGLATVRAVSSPGRRGWGNPFPREVVSQLAAADQRLHSSPVLAAAGALGAERGVFTVAGRQMGRQVVGLGPTLLRVEPRQAVARGEAFDVVRGVVDGDLAGAVVDAADGPQHADGAGGGSCWLAGSGLRGGHLGDSFTDGRT